jgi:hypothetical protein
LNNVRAIGSLEGMALTADPNFSLLEVVYPYVLRKVLSDFSYEDRDKNIGKKDTRVGNLIDVEGYQNIHDDTVKRLGLGASHTASGKTKEVFRNMILRRDKQSGLLLPRWKRLRRYIYIYIYIYPFMYTYKDLFRCIHTDTHTNNDIFKCISRYIITYRYVFTYLNIYIHIGF